MKIRSQEIPGVPGKFDLEVQNKIGKKLTEFYQQNALVMGHILFQNHSR